MKQTIILAALALSLCLGMASASDMTFTEQINRPGNFDMTDNAQISGWNSWSHMSSATAGTADMSSMFGTLAVPCGAAPLETSHETVQMTFTKNGQTVDPLIGETIDSAITVGAVGTSIVPTFDASGNIAQGAIDERYDIMKYTMGGSAGTPIIDSTTHTLTGITNDGSRQVFSQIMSSQDDYIHAMGFDSAGNANPVLTSYTDVALAPLTSAASPYVQLNWQDSRGWAPVVGDLNGAWKITNMVNYQMYNIPFNFGL
jgi:hypothetical protein